jgi:hypothetical protein
MNKFLFAFVCSAVVLTTPLVAMKQHMKRKHGETSSLLICLTNETNRTLTLQQTHKVIFTGDEQTVKFGEPLLPHQEALFLTNPKIEDQMPTPEVKNQNYQKATITCSPSENDQDRYLFIIQVFNTFNPPRRHMLCTVDHETPGFSDEQGNYLPADIYRLAQFHSQSKNLEQFKHLVEILLTKDFFNQNATAHSDGFNRSIGQLAPYITVKHYKFVKKKPKYSRSKKQKRDKKTKK